MRTRSISKSRIHKNARAPFFHPQLERLEPRFLMHGAGDDIDDAATVAAFSDPAAVAALSATQSVGISAVPSVAGQWASVASWSTEAVHAALLPTGKVMVWNYTVNSTFLYDPVTNTYSTPAQPDWNTFCAGQSLLADGRLFVAGGHIEGADKGEQPGVGSAAAGIYDPFKNTWTSLPDMNRGRWYPEVLTLANGNVLVLSGGSGNGLGNNGVPQIWDFATNSWKTYTGARLTDAQYPRAFQAPNGKVFEAGPEELSRYFDPAGIGKWSASAESLNGDRYKGSAVMYDNGKVIILGGSPESLDAPTKTVEVINLNQATPAWRQVASMAYPRKNFNATILADGTILATGGVFGDGGNNRNNPVLPAEIWNPKTETWTTVAPTASPHWYHSTALLLPDGRVLEMAGTSTRKAEIYSPPYLFKGTRPTIGNAPFSLVYGQNFTIKTPNAAGIQNVHLIRLGTATHSFNFDQGIERLTFTKTADGTGLTARAPANGNQAVPGYYMLFILNSSGVPSVAKIVHLGTTKITQPTVASTVAQSSSGETAIARGLATPSTGSDTGGLHTVGQAPGTNTTTATASSPARAAPSDEMIAQMRATFRISRAKVTDEAVSQLDGLLDTFPSGLAK